MQLVHTLNKILWLLDLYIYIKIRKEDMKKKIEAWNLNGKKIMHSSKVMESICLK